MTWRPRKRLRELPNGKTKTVWEARYKDLHGQVRVAKPAWNGGKGTFELKREAQRAIDEAVAQPAPEKASAFGVYLHRWLETRPRSERTDKTNEHRIRRVLAVELEGLSLEEWDMRDLRRRHAYELAAHMLTKQGRSPGGARNVLRALSAMAEDAITDELAELNPWIGVKVRDDDRRATKQARELRVWSFREMHEFASYAGPYEPMIRTMSDCGVRLGECLALHRADHRDGEFDIRLTAWEGKLIESSREKNHARIVPVGSTLEAMIRAMPVQLHSPYLYPTPTGCLWRESNWRRKVWRPTVEAANKEHRQRRLEPLPQEMRHSWVTHLRAAGIDPADLADVAGHSVETATSRYTHPLRRSFDEIKRIVG
jgi:integrase